MKKKHRGIKIALIVLTVLLAAVLFGAWTMFGTQLTAANTVTRLEDGLWAMEYRGDYGFDTFLAQGGAETDAEMGGYIASFLSHGFWKPDTSSAGGKYGCSAATVRDPNGNTLFGRNYDWADCSAMLIHTVPEDGYESVSTCCLDFLGFGEGWIPDTDMGSKFMALAAVYVPLDGMNEKGLCVADLMVEPGEVVHQDTGKSDLTTTAALRLLLDKAATVDEALALLEQYDMHASIDSAHHFALSDAGGRSVAVEYVGGEMVVTDTPVVTNHYVTWREGLPQGFEASYRRFETLTVLRERAGGVMEPGELRDAMASAAASQFNHLREDHENRVTQWTLICDPKGSTVSFYREENWEHPYVMKLGEEKWVEKGADQAPAVIEQVPDPGLRALRQEAADYSCAVAYVGYAENGTVEEALAQAAGSGAAEVYPFLKDIPAERVMALGGGDIYCVVPVDPDGIVTVAPLEYDEEGAEQVGEPVYAGRGEPILLVCNVSDIMPNSLVTVNGLAFSPYISLENGDLATTAPEGAVYDFGSRPAV